jgi:diguanylate cyclase (GGDEF)-like protein
VGTGGRRTAAATSGRDGARGTSAATTTTAEPRSTETPTAPRPPSALVGRDTDPTTGLAGRRALEELIATGRADTLMVIDLDGFRLVNEVLGYDVGDRVLRECARRLQRSLGPNAFVSRIGDDEFAVVTAGDTDPLEAADLVLGVLRSPQDIDGRPHTVTASIGVALASTGEVRSAELLRAADGALDRAKSRGGDRLEVFDPVLTEQSRRRTMVEQELRQGLETGQLRVHYQPQVSMTTGLICGVEALVRWEHPVHGLVRPDAFVPIAEETGLVRELGAVVVQQACADAVTLLGRRRHDGPFTMSVNVASAQMQDPEFVDTVAGALTRSGLDPGALCLEVTESAVLGHSLRTESVLMKLRELGVRFSIDDFGTGYSSLSYLARLPVDEVKIDRSFIVAMGERRGRGMVGAICGIAHALELDIVAEGVDDESTIALLRGWGCDTVQGFVYFRPESRDRVAKALRRDRPRRLPDPA